MQFAVECNYKFTFIVVADNLAHMKPAWQTSTYAASQYGPAGTAELAVDNTYGGHHPGDCAHTAKEVTTVL